VTFFSAKGDAVKLLKHHLEIMLQFVHGSANFIVALWTNCHDVLCYI